MYLLRRLERNRNRPDEERHGHAVLALKGSDADGETRSWLSWYQAVVHADRGNAEAAQRIANRQSAIDDEEPPNIRSRRHSLIRRLINDNADVQRNATILAKVTQLLHP